MLRIDRLRVTEIGRRYVYGRNTGAGPDSRAVKFEREDWPIRPDDVISIEYDIEKREIGERAELVDVAFVRVFDDREAESPLPAD